MRETDVRARIQSYLESKLRKAVLPMGLGMALAGCSAEPTPINQMDGSTDASNDVVAKYMGPMPDGAVAVYSAPMIDAGVQDDAGVEKYSAPLPDASGDGPTGVLYMAAMPK